MDATIHGMILHDHQNIVDGFRLKQTPQVDLAAVILYGEELAPTLKEYPADVLRLDVTVLASRDNSTCPRSSM